MHYVRLTKSAYYHERAYRMYSVGYFDGWLYEEVTSGRLRKGSFSIFFTVSSLSSYVHCSAIPVWKRAYLGLRNRRYWRLIREEADANTDLFNAVLVIATTQQFDKLSQSKR